ncbi:Uncharacterized protein dnm_087030 [Desulfonema magnum]|uniref:Uncharacterized protein n=1 Tax=Desulfonema magnum TaxID=45655 RepID=A0A975BVN8_9BACT|nr:Uncharacterized protein dnm_087030 [Desulfonema magnum]
MSKNAVFYHYFLPDFCPGFASAGSANGSRRALSLSKGTIQKIIQKAGKEN